MLIRIIPLILLGLTAVPSWAEDDITKKTIPQIEQEMQTRFSMTPDQAQEFVIDAGKCKKETDQDGCLQFVAVRAQTGWGLLDQEEAYRMFQDWQACGIGSNDCRDRIAEKLNVKAALRKHLDWGLPPPPKTKK